MLFGQLVEFIGNHWYLFLALVVILGLLTHNIIVGGKGTVDPLQATEMINHQNAMVVDVRPAADFAKGHIINALNIPMNGFKNQIGTLNKHQTRPIIINCRSGAQSAIACGQLRKAGFEQVFNLRGGIMAWESANLPLTRKKR
ncbi:MAG: rhodanese-like domain-containing protein [Sphingobacteriia bacterium]|nr:rhodanese-like domain-containing protein [Sphingobacteriia bacterium]NCC38681.1 rhodanese-like domain-containing protein [Gammaproteobacteria bacterium]